MIDLSRRWTSVFLLLLTMLAVTPHAQAQLDTDRRLEALAPADPMGYFLLAEEVAAESRTIENLQLARRLYVLAFALADRSPARQAEQEFPLAASACLGLAALETTDARKQWLRALAGRLDSRYAERRWDASGGPEQASEAAILLAEAVGLALSGDGSLARERLDDPRVAALLDQTREMIDRPGSPASSAAIAREAQIWPCPECGNARGVPDRAQGGQTMRLCSTCRGNPGPVITREALIAYLGYQSLLLRGTQKSWSAQLAVGLGRPLLDPEPSEVAPSMGVNPAQVHFRNGRWLTDEQLLELQNAGG